MNKFEVKEKGITIYDSYLVTDDVEKRDILTDICLEVEGLELCRSVDSMLTEWKASNILHRHNLFIEYKRSKFKEFLYKTICRLGNKEA